MTQDTPEPVPCRNCGEYTKCVCTWETCSLCGKTYSNYDPDEKHWMYEYRGALGCHSCIEEVQAKRDHERSEVMQETEHAVRSQADGEWHNGGYKYMKTDKSGRPITKVKEPLRLQQYEGRA